MFKTLLSVFCSLAFILIAAVNPVAAQFAKKWELEHLEVRDEEYFHHSHSNTGCTWITQFIVPGNRLLIEKRDPFGMVLWKREHNTGDYGFKIIPRESQFDELGNLYILGTIKHPAPRYEDLFIIKIGPKGKILWTKSEGGNSYENNLHLAVSPLGSVTVSWINSGNSSVYHVKSFRPDGTDSWSRQFDNIRSFSHILRYDKAGDVLASFRKWEPSPGQVNSYLFKLNNETGAEIFSTICPGGSSIYINDLVETPDGGYAYTVHDLIFKLKKDGSQDWVDYSHMTAAKLLLSPSGDLILWGYEYANGHLNIRASNRDLENNTQWDFTHTSGMTVGELPSDALVGPGGQLYLLARHTDEPWISSNIHTHNFVLVEIDSETGILKDSEIFPNPNEEYQYISLSADDLGNLYVTGNKRGANYSNYDFTAALCAWGCEPNVLGQVYYDADMSCLPSTGDSTMPYQIVDINNGQFFTLSDVNGQFEVHLPHGPHTLSHALPQYWTHPCQSGPISINVDTTNPSPVWVEFPSVIVPDIVDMRISMTAPITRPGFNQVHPIFYENVGTTTRSGIITLVLDSIYTYQSATIPPDSIVNDTLYWSYGPMAFGQSSSFQVTTWVDQTQVSLGDSFTNCITIEDVAADQTPTDNISCASGTVVGSYDPNDKTAYPAELHPGDQHLSYLIRFQNTGTDTAFTVVIRDTISEFFNLTSFKMGATSHPYTLALNPGRELVWTFSNILLPDSNRNEPASHGSLIYTLALQPNLPLYTEIPNTAAIYFDFNEPVITNTSISTIEPIRAEGVLDPGGIRIYPNPGNDWISVDAHLDYQAGYEITVFDMWGKKMVLQEATYLGKPLLVSIADLPAAVYWLRLKSQGKEWNGRVSKL